MSAALRASVLRFGLAVLLLGCSACTTAAQDPPTTVEGFDLPSYLGTWYEIASIPIRPQRGCTATTATYTMREDGRVDVLNRCRNGGLDGEERDASAIASIPDTDEPAKLKVQFFWPFRADYWVVDVDEEYRTAVVSNPARSTLWILHRQPCMDAAALQSLLVSLADRRFDLTALRATLQRAEDGSACQAELGRAG